MLKIIFFFYFFPSGHGNESYNLIGSQRGPNFPISDHGHSNARVSFFPRGFFSFESLEKINKLFRDGTADSVDKCIFSDGDDDEAAAALELY